MSSNVVAGYLMILTVIAPRLEASNAFLSAHISYRTQPMAQTSVLLSYARPCMQTALCQSNAGMGTTDVKQLMCLPVHKHLIQKRLGTASAQWRSACIAGSRQLACPPAH